MPKLKTLGEVYTSCSAEGFLRDISSVNLQKVESLVENANISISSANILQKSLDKDAKEWMNVFTLYYDALKLCTEALLHLKSMGTNNHQCLFAALCTNYPELELSWEFLEQIRTKRNRINYYGEQITYDDWKKIELQLNLYISTLKKEIKKNL